ncbi:Ff.00g093500.m01.CDS01 [Fusarium sp. VM40]|nr:Ff.00g093500.m01.CDS01 [Fusarium sp. VM40]
MGKNTKTVPDAWEDDWEAKADKMVQEPEQTTPQAPLSKSERLAQHAEQNRKLWESADAPQTFHYIEAGSNSGVPLTAPFKPQVKVLSRKPIIAKRGATAGMSGLSLDDDNEPRQEVPMSPEEIRAKQKRDREEKQRRYEEARAKIFGESNPSSGTSSPGAVTPPRTDGYTGRGRGRGRGGYRNNDARQLENRQPDNRGFDAPRRMQNASGSGRELFDPNCTPKPEPVPQRRQAEYSSPGRSTTPRDEQQQQQQLQPQAPIRTPKGPDGSGRGGFGFAQRGGKGS